MSTPTLRPFQTALADGIYAQWAAGKKNVLAVSPTGSGKTVVMAHVVSNYPGATCVIAHRRELVSQISLALARCGVRHALGVPDDVRRDIIALHLECFGRHYHDAQNRCRVIGIDTLLNMSDSAWFNQVGLWVLDEAHHLLLKNKWGRGVLRFVNAFGLGFTATPGRADGKGLGRHAAGLMDAMVLGPAPRELVHQGYLTDYRIFCPKSDIDLHAVPIGASGDYSTKPLRAAVHKSKRIVGDVVDSYGKYARGELGVTFAVDIDAANKLANAYRAAGVPAELVTADTPTLLRSQILRRFERRELLQLVNVDLFGEGFDLPAITTVSMARPTLSLPLYLQQTGRTRRPAAGKEFGIIIDHVGNVQHHKVPDKPRVWSLDNRPKMSRSTPTDAIPLYTCLECARPFERILTDCPYCGEERPEPAGRSTPAQVDGEICELPREVLLAMVGEVERIDGAIYTGHLEGAAAGALKKRHWDRQQAQRGLRDTMAQWGGLYSARGEDDAVVRRRFFHTFGIDVLSAMALNTADAGTLHARVGDAVNGHG